MVPGSLKGLFDNADPAGLLGSKFVLLVQTAEETKSFFKRLASPDAIQGRKQVPLVVGPIRLLAHQPLSKLQRLLVELAGLLALDFLGKEVESGVARLEAAVDSGDQRWLQKTFGFPAMRSVGPLCTPKLRRAMLVTT